MSINEDDRLSFCYNEHMCAANLFHYRYATRLLHTCVAATSPGYASLNARESLYEAATPMMVTAHTYFLSYRVAATLAKNKSYSSPQTCMLPQHSSAHSQVCAELCAVLCCEVCCELCCELCCESWDGCALTLAQLYSSPSSNLRRMRPTGVSSMERPQNLLRTSASPAKLQCSPSPCAAITVGWCTTCQTHEHCPQ